MNNQIQDTYGINGEFRASQDITAYLDYAADSRAAAKNLFQNQKTNYRSFAIIPDIVAVDIMTRFKVDVHDPENGAHEMQKIRKIIIESYPHLLTGNINKNPKGR